MTKKTIFILIAIAIVFCVSCKQEAETEIIENRIEAVDWASMERVVNNTKYRLVLYKRFFVGETKKGGARLKIWTRNSNEDEFDSEPDVVYTGSYVAESYITVDNQFKTSIVQTKRETAVVEFTQCQVKEGITGDEYTNFVRQASLYSGAFDFEYVSGYVTKKNETGGTTKSYGERGNKKTKLNLTVSMHPDYSSEITLLIGTGWQDVWPHSTDDTFIEGE